MSKGVFITCDGQTTHDYEGQMSDYTRIEEDKNDPNYTNSQDLNDGPSVSDFTNQIKSNIFNVNNGANTIERALKNIGTEKDSLQLRDKIHDTSQNTNKIVQNTTRLLHSVAEKKANKQQKIQLDLLKSQFQDSVQRFYTLQKKVADKVKSAMKLLQHKKVQQPLISLDDDEQEGILNVNEQQTQSLKDRVPISQDDMALVYERETRIRQLESDILDVNEIFRDLGALVQAQGDTLDTVDSNIHRAVENVEEGVVSLIKASEYQAKSRKKMFCLVCIFLVIAVIIITLIVVSLKI